MNVAPKQNSSEEVLSYLKSIDSDMMKEIMYETKGDPILTLNMLKMLLGSNITQDLIAKGFPTNNLLGDTNAEEGKMNDVKQWENDNRRMSLEDFDDLENIEDPDLKFAMQLQREELEREKALKRQQEDDEKFAKEMFNNSQNNSQQIPVNPSMQNSQNSQNSNISQNTSQRQSLSLNEGLSLNSSQNSMSNPIMNKSSQKKEPKKVVVEEDDGTCVVCLNANRDAIFVPCAHRCCCKSCAGEIANKKKFCPLCWMDLEGVIESSNANLK